VRRLPPGNPSIKTSGYGKIKSLHPLTDGGSLSADEDLRESRRIYFRSKLAHWAGSLMVCRKHSKYPSFVQDNRFYLAWLLPKVYAFEGAFEKEKQIARERGAMM
jgi:hypothetical protein